MPSTWTGRTVKLTWWTGGKEGFPLRHHRSADCPFSQTSWGGRDGRGSGAAAGIQTLWLIELSNQRDRLSRKVLVNATLYLVLKTRQHLWKVAGRWDTCLYFSPAKHATESMFSFLKKKKKKGTKEPRTFIFQARFHLWILFNQGRRVLSTFCKNGWIYFKFFMALENKLWTQNRRRKSPSWVNHTAVWSWRTLFLTRGRRQTKEGIIADQKMDETQKHKAWGIYVNFHLKKQKGHSEQFQTIELKKHSLRVE